MDFAGYLNLQKDHLLNLGQSSQLDSGVANQYIQDIQGKLDTVKNAYEEANVTTRDIVTHQKDVMDMVNTEYDRLNQKKASIDQAIDGQKRMITLNESYKMRYRYYLYMVITVLVTTVLYVIIRFLSKYLPGVPGAVWDLLLIVIFVIAVYILYTSYVDIQRRDVMNFNKLSYARPKKEDATGVSKITQVTSDGEQVDTEQKDTCVGETCCPSGDGDVIYDQTSGKCIANSFTLMNNEESTNLVKPNEPSEFTNYSKY